MTFEIKVNFHNSIKKITWPHRLFEDCLCNFVHFSFNTYLGHWLFRAFARNMAWHIHTLQYNAEINLQVKDNIPGLFSTYCKFQAKFTAKAK